VEDTWSAKTDLRIPVQVGTYSGYLKTGGQLMRRDKEVNGAELEFVTDFENTDVNMAQFEAPTVQTVQVGNGLFPFADTDQFVDWFFNEACGPPRDRKFSGDRSCQISGGPYTINAEEVQTEDVERDSNNEEEVYAGYGMASFDFGRLTALAGARVEHTITGSQRFQLIADDATGDLTTTSQNFENAYTDVLPSVHLTLEATDNLQFRAAWTNTIGRPDYDDLSAFSEVDIEPVADSDLFVAGIEEGNPDLQPFRAMNVDLTAEYYFGNGGLASVAGFYKQIENPIYTFSSEDRNVENVFGEGRTFQSVFRTQQRNADDGTIFGLEAIYQQPFTFLPAPFNGLGLVSNLTVTDSEVTVPERDDELPFFEQADLTYNIVPYFQKQGFELRVAWNYRGEFLSDLGDIPAEDEYVDNRTTVDVNARYQFTSLLGRPELVVQVENLTDAAEVFYDGQPNNLAFHYLSGRTVTLGLSVNL
jgi:TonB-dependent receptor